MKRPALALAAVALAAPLLAGVTPSTEAATEVRHYLDADQFGTSGHDEVRDLAAAGHVVASVGTVTGALPGQTSGGGTDGFVRVAYGDLTETLQLGGTGPDRAAAVATDGEHVLVGGHTENGFDAIDPGGWLMLLDQHADLEQTFVVPDGGGIVDVALAGGDVFAAGRLGGRGMVWKFHADGSVDWSAGLTVPDPDPDDGFTGAATRIMVLDDQVIATEVISYLDGSGDTSTKTLAIDAASGSRTWTSSASFGTATGITTDGEHIFVTRDSINFDTYKYIGVLSARAADGTFLWSETLYENKDLSHDARGVAWDGSAVVALSQWELIAFSPAGRRRWVKPLPEGLDPLVATYGATPYAATGVYVGGSTNRALGGPKLGGRDAVVGRFVLYQPDARVRIGPEVYGDDRYAKPGQQVTVTVARGHSKSVRFTAQNDGEVHQPLRLQGCRGRDGYDVRYRYGSTDLTQEMTRRRGYRANAVGPGGVSLVEVTVRAGRHAKARSTCSLFVSSIVTGERDRFVLAVRRP